MRPYMPGWAATALSGSVMSVIRDSSITFDCNPARPMLYFVAFDWAKSPEHLPVHITYMMGHCMCIRHVPHDTTRGECEWPTTNIDHVTWYRTHTVIGDNDASLSFTRSKVPPWKHIDHVSTLRLPVTGRSASLVLLTNSWFAAASTTSVASHTMQAWVI